MEDRPMTIVEHLEELRLRLLISLAAFAAATGLSLLFVERILAILIRPVGRVVFLAPTEAFFVRLKVAALSGAFLSLPVVLYQLWRFVSVGLTPTERRYALGLLPPALGLFVAGAAFAFWVILPVGVRFLLSYQTESLVPMISVGAYTSFATAFVLAFGVLFELPVVILFLARLGVVTPAALAAGRRYALLAIVVASAALTPGGDVASQLLMALPTYLLYEVSIWVARVFAPRPAPRESLSPGR
ncbi:MAG: twin-arginine translocase subunit TatC [Armatimonadota bacterium]|nr:twin-arginine translocase subunit TatC [Armatimonadota bacterium]MDR7402425.1 twin-arginine translocase subunit TatC [Armatimonadota bacterium]MDR7404235.1 twin-arginine translocase subunit TatC [Armatimonadota bacterium]MDR7437554.1 twin-arginine translocase subunit TatC [Armatimonadota bacterium]MDR7472148.1 twin-arginine translocase subunit TatC [Armatimonadota bacterium]